MDEDLIINPDWTERRQNRCAAFRFIFQWEMNPTEHPMQDLEDFLARLDKKEGFFSYAIELIDGILGNKETLDAMITNLVTNWDFTRVAKADLAILRLALYEINYRLDIPPVVALDEALELGREFSSDNSVGFLNGVLDKALESANRPTRKPSV